MCSIDREDETVLEQTQNNSSNQQLNNTYSTPQILNISFSPQPKANSTTDNYSILHQEYSIVLPSASALTLS